MPRQGPARFHTGVLFLLRWGAAGIAIVSLACWASTFWACMQVTHRAHGALILMAGTFEFRNAHYWEDVPGIDLSSVIGLPDPAWSFDSFTGPWTPPDWARSHVWLPELERWPTRKGNTSICVRLPLWIPLAASTMVCAWAWRRHKRLTRHGFCAACGYDRAGLAPESVCPECGNSVSA